MDRKKGQRIKSLGTLQKEEKKKLGVLFFVATYLALWSLLLNSPKEILQGLYKILVSPAGLLTDYFMLANPGAALMNAAIMTYLCLVLILKTNSRIHGVTVAGTIMVTAFSLFGKNPLNAAPIVFGVLLHARLKKEPFGQFLAPSFFATALGPLVSEIAFNMSFAPLPGILLGSFAGVVAGLLIPIFAVTAMAFHKGYNLYNIGFTAGIIGSFLVSITRGFGASLIYESQISSGYNVPMSILLFGLFLSLILLGIKENHGHLKGYRRLMNLPGIAGTDFIATSGLGLTIFNMGLVGVISLVYILLVGGELNGPTMGGVLAVVAFGAFGKHAKNILPVMLGVFLMASIGNYEVHATGVLLAASFGTTLAPIAGTYGKVAGIVAGMIHLNIVVNTGYLHGGLNLYNNGFAGGIVAAVMIPAFEFAKVCKNNFVSKHIHGEEDVAKEQEPYPVTK